MPSKAHRSRLMYSDEAPTARYLKSYKMYIAAIRDPARTNHSDRGRTEHASRFKSEIPREIHWSYYRLHGVRQDLVSS